MNFPLYYKNKIEQLASSYSISDLKKSALNISDKYLNESGKGDSLVNSNISVLAYAITRMPATFGALSFTLEHMLELVDDSINSVLDLGCGTGSSIVASKYLLKNNPSITCVEREQEMINFAKEIIDEDDNVKFINADSAIAYPKTKADLVIASYFLNELNDESRDNVLEQIYDSSNKYILIVEPGTPKAFNQMKKIREFYINKDSQIIAPCPHCYKCPIQDNDWCHFSTRIMRSKLHKMLKNADVPYEDEKFTYLVISKEKVDIKQYSRILRHPIINSGYISLILCNNNGEILNKNITKKNKNIFKDIKKKQTGDILDITSED